jgi:hypothetical protein
MLRIGNLSSILDGLLLILPIATKSTATNSTATKSTATNSTATKRQLDQQLMTSRETVSICGD